MGLLDRLRFAQRAGLQYGTKRDVYAAAGYTPIGSEDFALYNGLYQRDPIAGAIIDVPVEDCWASPPEIIEEDHPKGTEFTKALGQLAPRVGLWRGMANVDRVAGIGRFALLQLGLPGDQNKTSLETPGGFNAKSLRWLSVWSDGEAEIIRYFERDGMPSAYRLRVQGRVIELAGERAIHVPSDGTDPVFGRPRLRRALNVLDDLLKISSSTGESYWQSVQSILQAKIDPATEISADQLAKLTEDMGAMMHDLRRHFVGRGAELSRVEATVPNPSQTVELLFSLVAAASGIPRRRLFGSERGELASSQDEGTYLAMIQRRQRLFAEQMILRPTLDRLILLRLLPKPKTGEYQVTWPELSSPTAEEAAKANVHRAEAAAKLAGIAGDPLSLVEIDEDRNVWLMPHKPDEVRYTSEFELAGPHQDEPDDPEFEDDE
jgi:hypothetical protein